MSGNKHFYWGGLRNNTLNNQCSHHPSIDYWCPALLAPFSAIKRSSVSVVYVSGSYCSHGAYHAVAETRIWLKSATAQCTEDTHSYLGPAMQRMILLFPILSLSSNQSTLFTTFSSGCIHVSVTKEMPLKDFKMGPEEADSISVRKIHKVYLDTQANTRANIL